MLVHDPGPLTTIQDRGRPGWAHLGVPTSGVLDPAAAALANRLVGNSASEAVLEIVLGGLEVEFDRPAWVALTGARAPMWCSGTAAPHAAPVRVHPGTRLRLQPPADGLRSYLAVGGGIEADLVLGSRSTDTLAGLGPAAVQAGDVIGIGEPVGPPAPVDAARVPSPGPLRLWPGPRADWIDDLASLTRADYTVTAASNRIGMRLDGPRLQRRGGELPSEAIVLGAVQVPPDGRPVVFLADHPTTGGYPVVAVVDPDDLWMCAQVRPGDPVRFVLR